MPGNFLTKSRFKIGYTCPTKLCYQDDSQYGNNNSENSFLEALAEGGFQVGELAKIYHPGGTEIESLDKDAAVEQTAALMAKANAIIYEAAFRFENLFIKADVVLKVGKRVDLIEVKAKSFDPREESPFFTKASLKKGSVLRAQNGLQNSSTVEKEKAGEFPATSDTSLVFKLAERAGLTRPILGLAPSGRSPLPFRFVRVFAAEFLLGDFKNSFRSVRVQISPPAKFVEPARRFRGLLASRAAHTLSERKKIKTPPITARLLFF